MQETAKALIILGIVIVLAGAAMLFISKSGLNINLGRLPGDINIKRENFSFHFPIVTSIVISVIITEILNLFFRK